MIPRQHVDSLVSNYATDAPIDFDLQCWCCGYNLRSLNPASVCVECRAPISRTYLLGLARFLQRRKLRRILWGLRLIAAGVGVFTLFQTFFVLPLVFMLIRNSYQIPTILNRLLSTPVFLISLFLTVFLGLPVGAVLASPKNPGDSLADASRVAAAVTLIANLLLLVLVLFSPVVHFGVRSEFVEGLFLLFIWAVEGLAILEIIRITARRAAARRLCRRMRLLQAVLVISVIGHFAIQLSEGPSVVVGGGLFSPSSQSIMFPSQSQLFLTRLVEFTSMILGVVDFAICVAALVGLYRAAQLTLREIASRA